MRLLIFISIIVSVYSCSDRNESELGLKTIEFYFAPSFEHPTIFTIDVVNQTIKQYTYQDYYIRNERDEIDSNIFHPHYIDTLIVHYNKTFKIEEKNLHNFVGEIESSGLDSSQVHKRSVLDGIRFRVSKFNSEMDTTWLWSISPRRTPEFQMDYKILDAFFELAFRTIDDHEAISIIENTQNYFDYLPIRLIKKEPLEFRIHSSFYWLCEDSRQEITSFFNNLPNEPIIFDLRNADLAECLFRIIEEIGETKEIYFYGDNNMQYYKEQIEKIESEMANAVKKIPVEDWGYLYKDAKQSYEGWVNNKKIRWYLTRDELMKKIANTK